jgi:hypothetical protein
MGNRSEELFATNASEEGHAAPSLAAIAAGVGAIALGIGAANDTGWLAIAGGIAAGVGMIGYAILQHMGIEYDIYRRLENLEGKNKTP